MIHLRLLGHVALEATGVPGRRAAQRGRLALLALLACARHDGLSREKITRLLWPDVDARRARQLLSNSVYVVRQSLGEDVILADAEVLRLNAALVRSDVEDFAAALDEGDLERAVYSYCGPFLEGFHMPEVPEFQGWCEVEREALGRRYAATLEVLAQDAHARGDAASRVRWLTRLVEHDLLSTTATVQLVEALLDADDRAGAKRWARRHEQALLTELGERPGPQFQQLLQEQGASDRPYTSPPGPAPEPTRQAELRRPRRIAVLPLENQSGQEEHAPFVEGMTDTLITALARVRALRVITRQSVRRYRGDTRPLRAIARELDVDVIVHGTVLLSDGRVRVSAQLVQAETEEHLWADTYVREVIDVFALQDDLAREIAQRVGAEIQGELVPRRAMTHEAYGAYLQAVYHAAQGNGRESNAAHETCIALAPDFAPARLGLARNWYYQAFFGVREPRLTFPAIRQAAEHILTLDANSGEAHGLLALVELHAGWNWVAAERHFRRALELNPSHAQIHHDYAHFLLSVGRVEESITACSRSSELDPAHPAHIACLGWHHLCDHQYDLAARYSTTALEMAPRQFWPHMTLGWVHEQQGRFDEAVESLRAAVTVTGGVAFAQAALARALAGAGRLEEALSIARNLEERAAREYVPAYELAAMYAGFHQPDRALLWLQRAVTERSCNLVYLGWEPRFDPLRSHSEFTRVLSAIGRGATGTMRPAGA